MDEIYLPEHELSSSQHWMRKDIHRMLLGGSAGRDEAALGNVETSSCRRVSNSEYLFLVSLISSEFSFRDRPFPYNYASALERDKSVGQRNRVWHRTNI